MNCHGVRNILNALMDGAGYELATGVHRHLEACRDCREWYSETSAVLSLVQKAQAELPMPDIAGMVMSRLPVRHPASVIKVLSPRRILLAAGLAWFMGLLALIIATGAFYAWWHAGNGTQLVELGRFARSAFSVREFVAVMVAFGDVAAFIVRIMEAVGEALALVLVRFIILDCLVLSTAALVWRLRSHARSAMCAVISGI